MFCSARRSPLELQWQLRGVCVTACQAARGEALSIGVFVKRRKQFSADPFYGSIKYNQYKVNTRISLEKGLSGLGVFLLFTSARGLSYIMAL